MQGFAGKWLAIRHPDFEPHHHPLSIARWGARKLGYTEPLPDELATVAARVLHYGYGAFAGAVFATRVRRSLAGLYWPVRGPLFAWGLWSAAFFGYIPLLGIYKWPWDWEHAERQTTLLSHTVYGLTLAVLLEVLDCDE